MNPKRALVLSFGTIVLLGLMFLSPLRVLDNVFYDLNFAFSPAPAADSVVVVGIDITSIDEFGSWPWSRERTARLIRGVAACEPRAVAIDVLFPKSDDVAGNDSLASAFAATSNLVLPFRAGEVSSEVEDTRPVAPDGVLQHRILMLRNSEELSGRFFYQVSRFATLDPAFSRHADYGGFVNIPTSNTSQKLREVVHVMRAGDEYFPSFALASAAAYHNVRPDRFVLDGEGPRVVLGERVVPLSSYAATSLIKFRGGDHPIRVIPAIEVIRGTVDPALLRDKLVFVGITDAAAGADFFTTPVRSQFPGVEVWATATLDLLQGSWIRWGNGTWGWLNWLTALLIFPGLALLVPSDRKVVALVGGLTLLGASVFVSFVLFTHMSHFWTPSNHLFAWFFSLMWLAAQKADPSLAESGAPLVLEPRVQDEREPRPPPSPHELQSIVPDTKTAAFVIQKLAPQAAQTPRMALPTDVLEQFRSLAGGTIVDTLGSGGMADVYLVWHPRLEMYRAVKVIKPGQSALLLDRFETEIRIFSKLSHPNVVACYGIGEWHTLPTVEMEYVHGTAVESILRDRGRLTTPQALAIAILVCRALYYAHNQTVTLYGKTYHGVIHRDIKPANILLSRGGRVKLADFGIARPGETSVHTADAGQVVGTLPYLAPEQLEEDADLTHQTDIYALGATVYELIAGERAFPQRDGNALLKAKMFGTVNRLKVSEEIPRRLVDALGTAMNCDPGKRHGTAEEFGKELERCMRDLGIRDGWTPLHELTEQHWRTPTTSTNSMETLTEIM